MLWFEFIYAFICGKGVMDFFFCADDTAFWHPQYWLLLSSALLSKPQEGGRAWKLPQKNLTAGNTQNDRDV